MIFFFFFSSRRRHTRYIGDWSSDVCSSDLSSSRGRRWPSGPCGGVGHRARRRTETYQPLRPFPIQTGHLSDLTRDIWTSYSSDSNDIRNRPNARGVAKMNAQDGRAMYELQLELHARAVGIRPMISADDVLEVHELL